MGKFITCTSVGTYPLTRGRQYELLSLVAPDAEGGWVRVRADNGRCRWLPDSYFDLSGGTVPMLAAWRFDESVIDEVSGRDETNNWVDIVLKFDDGTQRWCQMVTPDYLKEALEGAHSDLMFYARNLIVVHDLATTTVEQVLYDMDQQGELTEFSLPFEQADTSEEHNE